MNKKNIILAAVAFLFLCVFAVLIGLKIGGYGSTESVFEKEGYGQILEGGSVNDADDDEEEIEFDENSIKDHESSEDYIIDSEVVSISLSDSVISSDSEDGIEISGTTLLIKSSGIYSLSGTLPDGQIFVDSDDEETVKIILDGVNIENSDSSAIYIKNSEKTVIMIASGSENYLSDGKSYVYENSDEDEPNAAIFSKSDLTIYGEDGTGKLTVAGNYNDAISSKDGLVINGVILDVESIDDGIRGKDYLVISQSEIEINCDGDALKSDNSGDSALGYINIENSDLDINSGGDGISGYTGVIVSGGEIDIVSGSGSQGSFGEDNSMKGIKAGGSVIINSGEININSSDDAIHSNGDLVINGGDIEISSGDDGAHADTSLTINDGNISISKSYEGVESAIITINGGNLYIVASDDGINVAGGNDSSAMGRPGQGGFDSVESGSYLYINGGYIYMNAGGDGLDSNGSVVMTGGTAIVNGPTNNGNGPLDYNGTFEMSGGYLVAVGSSGMAQAPSSSSSQYSVLINFDSTQTAGTLVNISDSSGNVVLTFSPAKSFQSVTFSSSELKSGETYTVSLGGSSTGSESNGLYEGGTYSSGNEYTTFTIENSVTTVGSSSGMGGGMTGGGRSSMTGSAPTGGNMMR